MITTINQSTIRLPEQRQELNQTLDPSSIYCAASGHGSSEPESTRSVYPDNSTVYQNRRDEHSSIGKNQSINKSVNKDITNKQPTTQNKSKTPEKIFETPLQDKPKIPTNKPQKTKEPGDKKNTQQTPNTTASPTKDSVEFNNLLAGAVTLATIGTTLAYVNSENSEEKKQDYDNNKKQASSNENYDENYASLNEDYNGYNLFDDIKKNDMPRASYADEE